jgi:arylsulfatase A-like enzyme
MSKTIRPNILFLMCDGMQGQILDPGHPTHTPNLDRLAASGTQILRAYSPNPICSPARASLMTGLLPHNHGVLEVIHGVDDDQCNIRPEKPHWAQVLSKAGYSTGYFGKWHVERHLKLKQYGWQVNGNTDNHYQKARLSAEEKNKSAEFIHTKRLNLPEGYKEALLYAVSSRSAEERLMGEPVLDAEKFLKKAVKSKKPWCCFVSLSEPNEPPICGEKAFRRYDIDKLALPPNPHDDFAGRPNVYGKISKTWSNLSDRERREALACHYAAIDEIDELFGRLMEQLRESQQLENTIIVFTSDHGQYLGAHGLYAHNYGAFEEVYRIPMILSGPNIQAGVQSPSRVGLHDIAPTLLDLANLPLIGDSDSRSFAPLLKDPQKQLKNFARGYSEYHGTRYRIAQRVVWDGNWKYVLNGFDYDEMYDLSTDPHEMKNLARSPEHQTKARELLKLIWQRVQETGDKTLLNSHWHGLRAAPYGPLLAAP